MALMGILASEGLLSDREASDQGLRPFSKNDWYGLGGAMPFSNGDEPLIANLTIANSPVPGTNDVQIVADAQGFELNFFTEEGESVVYARSPGSESQEVAMRIGNMVLRSVRAGRIPAGFKLVLDERNNRRADDGGAKLMALKNILASEGLLPGRTAADSETDTDKAVEAVNLLLKAWGIKEKFKDWRSQEMPVAIPGAVSSIFDTLNLKLSVQKARGGEWATVGWSWRHTGGGTNGHSLGQVGFDPDEGKWHWRKDGTTEGGYVG